MLIRMRRLGAGTRTASLSLLISLGSMFQVHVAVCAIGRLVMVRLLDAWNALLQRRMQHMCDVILSKLLLNFKIT